MKTIVVNVPDHVARHLDERVTAGQYPSASDYVRELTELAVEHEQLKARIIEGENSPLSPEVDDQYFENLKAKIRTKAA